MLLPEEGWREAMKRIDELNRTQQLLSKGIRSVDLRLDGRVVVEVAEIKDKYAQAIRKLPNNPNALV